jgi:hypothetical protein
MYTAMPVRNASGLRGVYKSRQEKYDAVFRGQYLGSVTSAKRAAMAYDAAARAAG